MRRECFHVNLAYLVGWLSKLQNWLESLFKTGLFPSITPIWVPMYFTCYWLPVKLFDGQECIVVWYASAYRISTFRSLFRDTSTDLPFTTVIQLNVHRQNSILLKWHKAKGGKQRRNSLFTIWWKTSLAFSGLTHVVLIAEAFWQGPYFSFSWMWRSLPSTRHLEEITWKYKFKISSQRDLF